MLAALLIQFIKKLLTDHLLPELVPIITEIVNSSLAGVFPATLKAALVKLLLKTMSLSLGIYKTFWPVEYHSFLSKIIEKLWQDWPHDCKWTERPYAVSIQNWPQYIDCLTSCPKLHSFSPWSEVWCVPGSCRFKCSFWHNTSPDLSCLPQTYHWRSRFSTKLVWLLPYWLHPMCSYRKYTLWPLPICYSECHRAQSWAI